MLKFLQELRVVKIIILKNILKKSKKASRQILDLYRYKQSLKTREMSLKWHYDKRFLLL